MDDRPSRLREARIAAGFEQAVDAAQRFHWNLNTYKSNENGNASFSFKKAKEYAKAFGVRPEWLYDASGPAKGPGGPPPPKRDIVIGPAVNLTDIETYVKPERRTVGPGEMRSRTIKGRVAVVGDVAAGLWKEAPYRAVDEETEYLAIDVAGYERAELRAWRVVGSSMNLVYPPGRYVVTAHPSVAGLRSGDYVVVERHKADLVEVTLKEFVVDEDGRVALWPRSTDPDFQAPIYLKGYDEHDQTAPQIVGVVIADYSRRERPPLETEPRR